MLPICLLIGYLLGVLISRKYHPTTKAEKIRTSIFAPLLIGTILCCFLAGMKSTGKNYMFGYYFGGYILFTIIPSIVTIITLLVKVKVIESSDETSGEVASTEDDNEVVDTNSNEIKFTDAITQEKSDTNEPIVDTNNNLDYQERKGEDLEPLKTDEIKQTTTTDNKIHDLNSHLIKVTSNIECTVYLDCEKIGTVSDGRMIKQSIPEGPYLLRCVSINGEVLEYSFELKKDELFNFKFKNTRIKKRL